MLEHMPRGLGQALSGMRAGLDKLLFNDADFAEVARSMSVTSPDFHDGGALPARFTSDGDGVSPAIAWSNVPPDAVSLVLVVEDADSPTPSPLVHAILTGLPPGDGTLPAGALSDSASPTPAGTIGRNSFLAAQYLPPDPPTGHGPHRYAFQLFALSVQPDFTGSPGRNAVHDAMRGNVLAAGCVVATYERV